MDIRRRVLRDFCKTQDDFTTLRDYNDYLELVEDIIFNLANNIDVDETKQKIQDYKEANREYISKNRNKMSAEFLELEDILAQEKRIEAKRKQEDAILEAESKSAKVREKEKLIDDLMFSDKDSKSILEEHKRKFNSDFAKKDLKNSSSGAPQPQFIEAKPFQYEKMELVFDGPEPPLDEQSVENDRFNKHIRPAEAFEKAAGYVESIGALRALQEAMSGLYYDQF